MFKKRKCGILFFCLAMTGYVGVLVTNLRSIQTTDPADLYMMNFVAVRLPPLHNSTVHFHSRHNWMPVRYESGSPSFKDNKSVTDLYLPPWDQRSRITPTTISRHKAFRQLLTTLKYKLFLQTFAQFMHLCKRHGIQYMLYGGSLIGAYRHFGMVPWDDDIDVLVNRSQKALLLHRVRHLTGYKLYAPPDKQWKFYKTDQNPLNSTFGWPYIDIFFFGENATHIWDTNPSYTSTYVYKKEIVFPLQSSPFETFSVPVPKCSRRVLDQTYNDVTICSTAVFSHQRETFLKGHVSVHCAQLHPYFMFVFRATGSGRAILKLGQDVIYTVDSPYNCLTNQ